MTWNRHISVDEAHRNKFKTKGEARQAHGGVFANAVARNHFMEWMRECGIQLIHKPEQTGIATERFKVANEDKYVIVNVVFSQYRNDMPGIIVNVPDLDHVPVKDNGEPMKMYEVMNSIEDKLTAKYAAHGGARRTRKSRRNRRSRASRASRNRR